jgi:hypothetical protein
MQSQRIKSLARISPAEECCFQVIRSLRRIEKDLRENLDLAIGENTALQYVNVVALCQENIVTMQNNIATLRKGGPCQLKRS